MLTIGTPEARATCSVKGNFRLDGGDWPMNVWITGGDRCTDQHFQSGNLVIFKRLNALSLPQHGKLELKQGGIWSYVPEASYKGPDRFRLEVCGVGGRGEGCARIPVDIRID